MTLRIKQSTNTMQVSKHHCVPRSSKNIFLLESEKNPTCMAVGNSYILMPITALSIVSKRRSVSDARLDRHILTAGLVDPVNK